MRSIIDGSGRLVVPKPLRDQLGFMPGTELDLAAVDGRLDVTVASRVRVEEAPHGLRLVADPADPLTTEVRGVIERGRSAL
jgi:bifunctional DNA-binding transcriptional regulator/antitoxin component of YhaV-PrlF toxin-antitoxin module